MEQLRCHGRASAQSEQQLQARRRMAEANGDLAQRVPRGGQDLDR